MSCCSLANTMNKPPPKKAHPLILLFVPTTIVAVAFLLVLACNGFFSFTLAPVTHDNHLSTQRSITEAMARSHILEIKALNPIRKPVVYQRSELFQENNNGSSSEVDASYIFVSKFKVSERTEAVMRSLNSNARSMMFSTRAEDFFRGSSTLTSTRSSCGIRFFMTWISSLKSFGQRELFAVESLFKAHPDACLLVLSNTMDSAAGTRLLRPFTDNGFRVAAMCPDYNYLFNNTPAELWFAQLRKGEVNPGLVSLGQNLSNLLRLAALYKYGGVYIDTDVIIIKRFSGLTNVIGAQSIDVTTGNWTRLNNAVLVFDKCHPLLDRFMEEFTQTFDGSRWGHNGPYLVSRVVSRLEGSPGFEFTVLPPEAFYPVGWSRIDGLFKTPGSISHSKWVTAKLRSIQEKSYAVHLWNSQSRNVMIEEGSIIGQIMLGRCLFCNSSLSVNK